MQKRFILWLMICFFLACNTIVTLNMDIAIISMVNFHRVVETSNEQLNDVVCPNTTFFLRTFLNNHNEDESPVHNTVGRYNWSKKERTIVLSGYYWLNYLSILPAGVLAQKYGSKKVVGIGQGLASVMSSLIPIFADNGYFTVACIRAIQGILSFMAMPAGIHTIIGNWSPPQERSTFQSAIAVGSCLGFGIGNFYFGYIGQYAKWQYIFHSSSICGVVWLVLWCLLVYDKPENHPTITAEEKEYIKKSLQKSPTPERDTIPWKNIITSVPVIVSILAYNSIMWCFVMSVIYLPVYFKTVYGLESGEIGVMTSIPILIGGLIVFIAGYTTDHYIKKQQLTLTIARKGWTFIGCILSSFPLIVIAFTKCDLDLVIICSLLRLFLGLCSVLGPMSGMIDMSPKFCGILEGISGTTQSIITFIFALAVNELSNIMETEDLWKFVFTFSALFAIVMNSLYVIFGSTKVQWWNFEDSPKAEIRKEKY